MSLFLQDAEQLHSDAESGWVSAQMDLDLAQMCFGKEPSESNKKWVETSRKKEAIMCDVVDELKELVEIAKIEDEMMNDVEHQPA